MYAMDRKFGRDSSTLFKTASFKTILNIKLYKPGEDIFVCSGSDFFHKDADEWRSDAWSFIKQRKDLRFMITTKRIELAESMFPKDWKTGYDNIWICCTTENQAMADLRLPIFNKLPCKHKTIIVEPMLEGVNLEKYLKTGKYIQVLCGGENGVQARQCKYEWAKSLHDQCEKYNVNFDFKQVGTRFVLENGEKLVTYNHQRQWEISQELNLNFHNNHKDYIPIMSNRPSKNYLA
jgi:protein gp37